MIRSVFLFVLLSGCATSRLPDGESPSTLAEVNRALEGERVRIELADRYVVAQATRVRVSLAEVSYH